MLENKIEGRFVYVLSDGSIREKAEEGKPGAVRRDYEDSKGVKGTKYEYVYKSLSGQITGLSFQDGDFGLNLYVEVTDVGTTDGEPITLVLKTDSSFGEDFMKKLPNIDLTKKVKLVPYSFLDEQQRAKKGISVFVDEEKIQGFFYDPVTKKELHGFPVVEGDRNGYDKDDWKVHFIKIRKFLVKYTEENVIPKLGKRDPMVRANIEVEIPAGDIPF